MSDAEAQPKIRVRGGSGPLQTRVELAVLRAMQGLGYAESLQVTIKREPASDQDAGARLGPDGVLWVNLGLAKHGEPLLGWVLSEEIAHHWFATRYDVRFSGEFVEVLLHELFATWFQIRENVVSGRMSFDDLITAPVPVGPPTAELGEHLGKQIAGAASGSAANAAHLETWFADPEVDELTSQFARVLLDGVPYDGGPLAVAQALREIYDEILAGAGN
ncbi:MAG TPA: hypothetical protein VGO80_02710 [Solirubrobacteraceae bacterium]|nr:hypothetical protein [Solirubrobacteraceae bacterium]